MPLEKKICPVRIVGAGPGDPELMTLKALRLLGDAEAVVHDRLIPESILRHINANAERFFAGKSREQHVMTQDEINDLLVKLARAGRKVVRLKGGDPLIFGRGGEEAEHLARHGIPFEIVPGVSAALGCGACAGIPLTHRGLATGVRFITGHGLENGLTLDWRSLADADTTLVVYMGLANLGIIAGELAAHGLAGETPAAAIQDGTTRSQRVVVSTLGSIAADVNAARLQAPVLIIIGRVVGMRRTLATGTDNPAEDEKA